jgi:hypothetical protein
MTEHSPLAGVLRDGCLLMTVRAYYEDMDFSRGLKKGGILVPTSFARVAVISTKNSGDD